MNELNELSIADLKAAGEYVEKMKGERVQDLKSQGVQSKDDNVYQELDKLSFDIHTNLFSRLMKLKKS